MEQVDLHLKSLSLNHFKNHEEVLFSISKEVTCFVGKNGVGKTNLLDAIHYLSFCKSYFQHQDALNVAHGQDYFVVKGLFERSGEGHEIYCAFKKGGKKVFKRNNKDYKRLSDHIGKFPVVMISPADTDLIREGSEVRRKFLDAIISQYDRSYLQSLIRYNKVLLQRNALLKQFAEQRYFEGEALAIWDEQMIQLAAVIYAARQSFIDKYIPIFQSYHNHVSGGHDEAGIQYFSPLEDKDMRTLLAENLEKDRFAQRTTQGIHKDDLILNLGDHLLRKLGSQGQQKTFYIAMKLAQYQWLKQLTGVSPLLLLDDIFDKLDSSRVAYLMKLVSQHEFGQIFITDTQPERIESLFDEIDVSVQMYEITPQTVVLSDETPSHAEG